MPEFLQNSAYLEKVAPRVHQVLRCEIGRPNTQILAHPDLPNGIFDLGSTESTENTTRQIIEATVLSNSDAHIRCATGYTYQRILAQPLSCDTSHVWVSHWDEYWQGEDNRFRFAAILKQQWDALGIRQDHRIAWNGYAPDSKEEMHRVLSLLKQHPVDLTLAGIGPGSHIGYNTPGTPWWRKASMVDLDQETLQRDHDRDEYVSDHALTVGVYQALKDSRLFLLVAMGTQKGDYLADMLTAPINQRQLSAAALRLVGPKVITLIDHEAATQLQHRLSLN